MATKVSTLYSELWKELSHEDRSALTRAVGIQDSDPAAIVSQLSDRDAILRRTADLSDEHEQLLYEVCFESGLYIETFDPEFEAELRFLFDAGLILPTIQEGVPSWVAPLEVRTALAEPDDLVDADLALTLYFSDDESLDSLVRSHQLTIAPDSSRLERIEAIAHGLLDPEHLEQLLESLTASAHKLLSWLIQHDGPVTQSDAMDWVIAHSDHDISMSTAVLEVLHRLGLIQSQYTEGLRLWTIASDMRSALLPILTAGFNQPAANAWTQLREGGQPSFRDTFPRGAAGSPLLHARYRLVRCISQGIEEHSQLDALLREFFIYDAHQQTAGALASYQLDVQTPDAFARHMLRVWTGSLDDVFTRALIAAFEGDAHVIARWIGQNPAGPDDEGGNGFARQLWLEMLVQFRGIVIASLGCLSAGVWYQLDHLANYLVAAYRRTVWQYGRYRLFSPEFPYAALPVGTEDIQPAHLHALRHALDLLMEHFFEVIGAAQRDPSGELFIVNTEAFRVFRESDLHFDGLWEAAEAMLDEDIDLWLPLPGEQGPQPIASPSLKWHADGSLSIPADAPLSDLVRIAEWGTPHWEGPNFRFTFESASFLEDTDPEDLEEFLVWLVVRAESSLPDVFRSLVPLSYAEADESYESVLVVAEGYVTPLLHALEAWGESPSLAIMEELRSWGRVLEGMLLRNLKENVEAQVYDSSLLRHVGILLGELRSTDAVPLLLHVFLHCTDDRQEGALGMTLARIGAPALNPLRKTLYDQNADTDKRLATAGVLTSIGVLHPHLKDVIFQHFRLIIRDEDTRDDVATILAVYAADLGHMETDTVIRGLQHEGRWVDEVMPFEDALWTAAISPCNWGHPTYAGPLAQVFPNVWESEEVLRAAGIDEVMRGSSVEQATVLGRPGGWRRRT